MAGRGGVRGMLARLRGRDIEIKTPGELEAMRAAGALVARTLAAVTAHAAPGVSTAELDALAEQTIRDGGAVPSFLGYHGYPASI
ncbi:MAG TPA: M24 family metallopeptidase, partial [Naasia sp.]